MPASNNDASIDALSAVLSAKGLDAGDLIDAINILANIKKRDAAKDLKEESNNQQQERKIFGDKEFVYETRRDVFIYRDLRTKSGRYYVRIYDEKTKRTHSESLRTSNRNEAIVKAEQIYRERKDALRRGVKV